jgi:hypothetical protein
VIRETEGESSFTTWCAVPSKNVVSSGLGLLLSGLRVRLHGYGTVTSTHCTALFA